MVVVAMGHSVDEGAQAVLPLMVCGPDGVVVVGVCSSMKEHKRISNDAITSLPELARLTKVQAGRQGGPGGRHRDRMGGLDGSLMNDDDAWPRFLLLITDDQRALPSFHSHPSLPPSLVCCLLVLVGSF